VSGSAVRQRPQRKRVEQKRVRVGGGPPSANDIGLLLILTKRAIYFSNHWNGTRKTDQWAPYFRATVQNDECRDFCGPV